MSVNAFVENHEKERKCTNISREECSSKPTYRCLSLKNETCQNCSSIPTLECTTALEHNCQLEAKTSDPGYNTADSKIDCEASSKMICDIQKCQTISSNVCNWVPRKKCKTVPMKKCDIVETKICIPTPKFECIEVCEEVFWCKQCSDKPSLLN